VDELDYAEIVALYHEGLYRFAFSLARNSDDAAELTQEAYCRLLSKGASLRDPSKVKSWLFTTVYRIFLSERRHEGRFPHLTLSVVEHELPVLSDDAVEQMDATVVCDALLEIDEHHRTPLMLFYLKDHSYREIAEILGVPVGTIMSRLSRAKVVLRDHLTRRRDSSGTATPITSIQHSTAK
jgi:RNA polymerase sigma-70 factor (ECF subfamily)